MLAMKPVPVSLPFVPAPFYYLHNFEHVIRWLNTRYRDLLAPDEQAFLRDFATLPQVSQALMVRLLMRKGPVFRADKVAYDEIGCSSLAAAPLIALGWLDADAELTPDELFGLYTKVELSNLIKAHGLSQLERKSTWLDVLRVAYPQPRRASQWRDQVQAPVWRVQVGDICDRLRLLFFGNLHQDWTEFVLADLGVFQYELVAFSASDRAFQCRADVEHYLALHQCRQALEGATDPASLVPAVVACTSENAWIEQRRAKLLLRIGQACERQKAWEQALSVYEQCTYPGARHRRIRVLEQLGDHQAALMLAHEASQSPESEEEAQRVIRMLPRLRRHLGLARGAADTNLTDKAGKSHVDGLRFDLSLLPPANPMPVEWVLRDYLHTSVAPTFYVENTLINGLFGLLCWRAIFAPLPGAFFHPFQRGPADLHAPDFSTRRAALFADCLAELDTEQYRETILANYREKLGRQSPFVAWAALDETLLRLALDCVPAEHLKLWFARLLADVKTNRSGLPDLIRFWSEEKRYELIEVKGPGDRLQDNQVRWLQYCLAHDMPVRVCHVQWTEVAP